MKKSDITAAIKLRVGTTPYGIWRIGLTHDPAERKKYWKKTGKQGVPYWSDWNADSLSDAREIESYFINEGMKGGTGGELSVTKTTCVYIF